MFQARYHALIYKRTNGTACPLLVQKKFVVHQKEFVGISKKYKVASPKAVTFSDATA